MKEVTLRERVWKKAKLARIKLRIKMASHYHNKQAVRWLVTAKCSMSLCLFHAALINTLRERTLLSPCNVYLRCVKHGPSVSSLFLEVDFFQTPPVEILSSRRSQTFLFTKIFHSLYHLFWKIWFDKRAAKKCVHTLLQFLFS